ncbi:MAG: chloride channel protein [Bdellovibrionaceae bacterium]|nr:chloride channel protein [Pseudobdellovibrionaceae bacterium]
MALARWIFFSILIGIFAGISATLFLYLLTFFTEIRQQNGVVIWFLPIAGLAIGLVYHYWGTDISSGNDRVLEEVYRPHHRIPFRMAPFILFSTLATHLFGGSAGREGTAVQMAAALADQLGRFFKITNDERKIFLISGMGAGFGAAIGAPLAGMIFGIEVVRSPSLWKKALLPSFLASVVGYAVTRLLLAPHTDFPELHIPPFSVQLVLVVLFSGLVFGSVSQAFIVLTESLHGFFNKISYPPLRPLLGGIFLVGFYYLEGSYQYVGLGLDNIQNALITPSSYLEPGYKLFFTAFTLSSGFKGGEFVPLVFIGTTLGSTIGVFFPAYYSLAAGLGFASVFAAASKTPLACSVMAVEIFGFGIAPYILICCWIANRISGKRSIYRIQQL